MASIHEISIWKLFYLVVVMLLDFSPVLNAGGAVNFSYCKCKWNRMFYWSAPFTGRISTVCNSQLMNEIVLKGCKNPDDSDLQATTKHLPDCMIAFKQISEWNEQQTFRSIPILQLKCFHEFSRHSSHICRNLHSRGSLMYVFCIVDLEERYSLDWRIRNRNFNKTTKIAKNTETFTETGPI